MAKALKQTGFMFAGAGLVLACALAARSGEPDFSRTPLVSPSLEHTQPGPVFPPATRSVEAAPGLLLEGSVVLDNGAPLQGVIVCRSFASYPGESVGLTAADGEFTAEFVKIPGDEMVTVWPYLEGYTFEPAQVYWRHYFGYESRNLVFLASPQGPGTPASQGCR